jgi:hypothetical protein
MDILGKIEDFTSWAEGQKEQRPEDQDWYDGYINACVEIKDCVLGREKLTKEAPDENRP